MEEEIDLRPYIRAVMQQWYWVLGTAVILAIIAFVIVSQLAPSYQATAMVSVTEARQDIRFDPRITTVDDSQPIWAFPELAVSDGMAQTLLDRLDPPVTDLSSVADLQAIMEAEPGRDARLLQLYIRYSQPDEAARLANTWAAVFVERANSLYSDPTGGQLPLFESQLVQATVNLAKAENDLIEFQSINRQRMISNTLTVYEQTQMDYLQQQQQLEVLTQDVTTLRHQIAAQPSNQPISLADQLTALSLQLKTYNAESTWTLQVVPGDSLSLAVVTRPEQMAALDGLLQTLSTRLTDVTNKLTDLEVAILRLQQEWQQVYVEETRLTMQRNLAQETYTTLARKVEESRLTVQGLSPGFRVASRAASPQEPVGPRRLLITAVALVLGLFAGLFLVLAATWWRMIRSMVSSVPTSLPVSGASALGGNQILPPN